MFENDKKIKIDIKNYVLEQNGWKNLTEGRIQDLKEKNVGKKVTVIKSGGKWDLYSYSEISV